MECDALLAILHYDVAALGGVLDIVIDEVGSHGSFSVHCDKRKLSVLDNRYRKRHEMVHESIAYLIILRRDKHLACSVLHSLLSVLLIYLGEGVVLVDEAVELLKV